MKISNKPNIAAGSILLLVAAFFSISLALLPLDFGAFGPGQDTLLYTVAYTLGDMLFSVYGYSSILIPLFLFVAGLSCFAKKWTAKQSMRLLTAVVPFFTSVVVEKICRSIAEDYTDELAGIKVALTAVIGLMLMVIEVIGAGLIADRVNDFIFHKEKYEEDKKRREAELAAAAENAELLKKAPAFQSILPSGIRDKVEQLRSDSAVSVSEDTYDKPVSTEEVNLATEPTLDQSSPTEEGVVAEETASEQPAADATEPELPENDPFAHVFDEEESAPNSMITQEEYAALNSFGEDQPAEEEPAEDELEWPDTSEIKAQAGAVEEEADSNDDDEEEFVFEEEADNSQDDEEEMDEDDFDPFAFGEADSEESEEIIEEEEAVSEAEQDGDDSEMSLEDNLEAAFDEFERYNEAVKQEEAAAGENDTLSPDFFDIDMNSEEEIEEEEETAAAEPENPTISFGSDVFAEMENDARRQLANDQDDSFFDGSDEEPSEEESDDYSEENSDFQEEDSSEADIQHQREELSDFFDANSDEESSDEEDSEESEEKPEYETTDIPVRTTVKTEPKKVGHRAAPKKAYKVPTDLLEEYEDDQYWLIDDQTKEDAVKLKNTLTDFGISAEVTGIKKGPVVTMFEIAPAPGVRLSKIVSLQDNIALNLAASSVRIVAPIPGKAAVGIEVPNRKRSIVSFREMIEQDLPEFKKMAVPVILGKDILGKSQIIDIAKTPHLLIAGATGAGKSVCVNSIILSILYKRSPQQVKMILVDPKVVELKLYNDIPHLLTPVITEPKKALQALQWCLCEMERRYALLDQMGVRDISSYNNRIEERNICTEKLPYIVIIIDEFADLMATSGKELESNVARLAAMSRAVGIHLVLATQRPSVNVITGLIKANIPSRIAFMVASRTDSNIIIDSVGAEKLLGKGDMLYASAVDPYPIRIQGTFESDTDVESVVDYVKTLGDPDYIDDQIFIEDDEEEGGGGSGLFNDGCNDPLYEQALDIVIQSGKASASYLQRRLSIGYNRAARLVEEMEERGIVGPANGSKPREIIHVPN